MMTTSFFSDSAPARECNLFVPDAAPVHIDVVLSSLVSMRLARDHLLHEYCAVAQLILIFVDGNGEMIPKDGAEVLDAIIRVPAAFPDQKRGLVTDLFLAAVEWFVFAHSNCAIDWALRLISEFCAPDLVRVCIADLTLVSIGICRAVFQ
jgi:hypothetical protein